MTVWIHGFSKKHHQIAVALRVSYGGRHSHSGQCGMMVMAEESFFLLKFLQRIVLGRPDPTLTQFSHAKGDEEHEHKQQQANSNATSSTTRAPARRRHVCRRRRRTLVSSTTTATPPCTSDMAPRTTHTTNGRQQRKYVTGSVFFCFFCTVFFLSDTRFLYLVLLFFSIWHPFFIFGSAFFFRLTHIFYFWFCIFFCSALF